MIAFFQKFWSLIRQLLGLILPVFSKAGDLRRFGAAFRWLLRAVLLALFLGALWFLGRFIPPAYLLGPPAFKPLWLPAVGLSVVVFCWLGWWIWRLLNPEEEASDHPDIDEAWAEAVRALHRAGTDLTEAPLFLVLGKPFGPEEDLFHATGLQPTVRQAPQSASAPLYLYAFREGKYDSVFITCAGASLLGKQATLLTGELGIQPSDDGDGGSGEAIDPFKTARAEGEVGEMLNIVREARRQGRELTEDEKQQIYRLERRGRPSLLRNNNEVAWTKSRLRHLCRLIVRERRPFCAINGMVLLIPWKATGTDEDANETGILVQQDLATAREVFRLQFPLLAVVCDMETAPGFPEFIRRFDPDKIKQRLGKSFPLAPDLAPAAVLQQVEQGARWICRGLFPSWIYRFLNLESANAEKTTGWLRGNGELVKLMSALHERQKRFGEILTRGLAREGNGPLLYAGCYVAATGSKTGQDQAFVPGVFRKVIENQNYVSWTKEALNDEASHARGTMVGYILIAIAVVATPAVLFFLW